MKQAKNVKYYLAASAALATFLIYLPALSNEFVQWDDGRYVLNNLNIRSLGPAFFRWAFFDFHASNWHPLTWVSHALDYAIWGLNPLGHHLTNIILHAVNTFLVVLLILRLLEAAKGEAAGYADFLNERTMLIAAGTTGALFGFHPLHVESVAWVAERKDLLCALFFLLSIIAYVRYAGGQGSEDRRQRLEDNVTVEGGRRNLFIKRHYLLSLALFALALMSKPMAVTLPVVLLLLDWYPFQRISSLKTFRVVIVEKLPFIALSLASSILTILAQQAGDAIRSTDFAPLSIRVMVGAKALIAYLGKMIWPLNLIPFYPYPKNASLLSFEYLLPMILVAGITLACVLTMKKQRIWSAVWGYYIVTLLPVLGLVQVGSQSMADRYTYLPSLAPFLLAGLAVATGAGERKVFARERRNPTVRTAVVIAALLVAVSLLLVTYRQIHIWKNSIDLWSYVIAREPGVPLGYHHRGLSYGKMGRYREALADFDQAIALDVYADAVYYNRGVTYGEMGRIDEALADFDTAIALYPPYYEAYVGRARLFTKIGAFDKAIKDFTAAIALQPSNKLAYNYLGALYLDTGFFEQAGEYLSKSIALDPLYAEPYNNRGIYSVYTGQYDKALKDFDRAIELQPENAVAHRNRGSLYRRMGDEERALANFQRACELGNKEGCSAFQGMIRRTMPDILPPAAGSK